MLRNQKEAIGIDFDGWKIISISKNTDRFNAPFVRVNLMRKENEEMTVDFDPRKYGSMLKGKR